MSKNINILYVSPNGYLGGAERAVLDFCSGHKSSIHVNSSLLFFNDGMAVNEAKALGLDHIVIRTKFKLSNIPNLLKALFEIRKILKEKNIKVIHSTMPYAHIVMSLASLFLPNIKRVWFQHGPVGGTLDKIASLLPVNCLLYNSNFTKIDHKKSALRLPGSCSHHIINLPIIIKKDSKASVEILNFFKSIKDKTILLQVGRICSWKGNHLAILALNELVNNQKKMAFKLIIVGSAQRQSDQEYYDYLKTLTSTLKLNDYVDFIANTTDPQIYMQNSHVFLHTSTTKEPFGLVVAEAMINNLFVIGSDQGGVCDILINNETGYSFTTNESSASLVLAQKIIKFQESQDDVLKMKKKAFGYISKNHNIKDTTKVLEEIYLSF